MQRRAAGLRALVLTAIPLLGGCAAALSEAEPSKDVFCVQRAQVSLKDAVETAEKQGGRAVDAHFRQDEELGCLTDKPSYYEVTLLSRGALRTVDVDAHSNQAHSRPRKDESLLKRMSKFLDTLVEPAPVDPSVAPRVRLSLPAAIDRAEEPNAKAVAAQLEQKDGVLGYTVKLVENGKLKLAWIAAG
jgi:uncharacterized membrane protein YkoI